MGQGQLNNFFPECYMYLDQAFLHLELKKSSKTLLEDLPCWWPRDLFSQGPFINLHLAYLFISNKQARRFFYFFYNACVRLAFAYLVSSWETNPTRSLAGVLIKPCTDWLQKSLIAPIGFEPKTLRGANPQI